MQPVYSTLTEKHNAREHNIQLYRDYTGRWSIPSDRQYVTLCNLQPDAEGSEINQVLAEGLITDKSQFVGVDRDAKIIAQNKKWHPEAQWFAMDWLEMLYTDDYNPGLAYLDSTQFISSKDSVTLFFATWRRSPPGTVVIFNAMLSDPYGGRDVSLDEFCDKLRRKLSRRMLLRPFYYTSSKTQMVTLSTYKE